MAIFGLLRAAAGSDKGSSKNSSDCIESTKGTQECKHQKHLKINFDRAHLYPKLRIISVKFLPRKRKKKCTNFRKTLPKNMLRESTFFKYAIFFVNSLKMRILFSSGLLHQENLSRAHVCSNLFQSIDSMTTCAKQALK